MDDRLKATLEVDRARGEEYDRAWTSLIEPFFDRKNDELFEAFKGHPTTDSDGLMTIKMQVNALEALKDEFQHYINTGNMASAQLEKEESNG